MILQRRRRPALELGTTSSRRRWTTTRTPIVDTGERRARAQPRMHRRVPRPGRYWMIELECSCWYYYYSTTRVPTLRSSSSSSLKRRCVDPRQNALPRERAVNGRRQGVALRLRVLPAPRRSRGDAREASPLRMSEQEHRRKLIFIESICEDESVVRPHPSGRGHLGHLFVGTRAWRRTPRSPTCLRRHYSDIYEQINQFDDEPRARVHQGVLAAAIW